MLSDYQQTIKATTSLRGLSAVSIVATNELRDLIKSCDVGFKLYTDHSTSARDELKKLQKIQDSFQMVKQEFRDAQQTVDSLQDSIEQRLGEFEMSYKKWTVCDVSEWIFTISKRKLSDDAKKFMLNNLKAMRIDG